MDRLKLAFVELQASWAALRDQLASVDGAVAWSSDAVDADLQRLVVSFAAAGIMDSSDAGDDASDRTVGAFCALDVGCEIEPPDALPEKPWLRGRIGTSLDFLRASDALHAVCFEVSSADVDTLDVVQYEISSVLRRHERLAVLRLRQRSLYFYVDFQLFVKLLQRVPADDGELAWYRVKFFEWALVMPFHCRRGSGDELRITMEVPGLFFD